ncbi:hypothetical protein PLUTE_b0501 [Pseudoalteromonas luteoviolacea DSM 6061]|nr:hypothetical protein [Pseudoalteromonas luteoviolacea DSM 6061]
MFIVIEYIETRVKVENTVFGLTLASMQLSKSSTTLVNKEPS